MKATLTRWATMLCVVMGAVPANAQSGAQDALRLRTLAATCANCHGTDGRAPAASTIPSLAGAPRAELAQKLQGFKSGERPSTVMQQLARGYSDAQIDQLADYFSRQKP